MLIVGEADNNVPPESTYRVADVLIKAHKTFDFLTIPGSDHTSGGAYGNMKRKDFFVQHLLGVLPPDRNNNELTIDKEGRLIVDQHGNRRVIRLEKKGPVTVLADKIGGPMDITLRVNGESVGKGTVPAAMSLHFTSNATFDIGTDLDSPVSLDYYDQAPFKFNGTIGTSKIQYLKKK